MEKPDNSLIKQALCWLLVILACLSARAQKLPAKQEIGLRAPKNAKADGKLTEWGVLQAHNNSTGLNYTVANNNETLFVVMQATDPSDIKKILIGNITLTINTSGVKDDKAAIAFTFPYVRGTGGTSIGIKLTQRLTATDSAIRAKQTDSLVRLMNEDIGNKAKEIMVQGVKGLPDGLVSVYNEEGIKITEAFDHNRALNFEVAIPLKYLGLFAKENNKFTYRVTLNGIDQKTVINYPDGTRVFSTPHGLSPSNGASVSSVLYPTDFSGQYTLIN